MACSRTSTRARCTLFLVTLLLVVMPSAGAAQVRFNGDARIRPRLDLDDRTGGGGLERSAFYVQYRLRLDMTADLGSAYYVKGRLGHNGIAFYARAGRGGLPDVNGDPNTASDPNAARPSLDMMYMYLGRATKQAGFDLGLIPIPGLGNPLFDLHYYPNQMIDVPYFIWSTDGGFGAHGYVRAGAGTLRAYTLLDRSNRETLTDDAGATVRDYDDQYTAVLSYALPIGGVVIEPMVMKTFSATLRDTVAGMLSEVARYNAPLTAGANLTLPRVAGLVPTLTAGWTQSDVGGTADVPVAAYHGWLARAKLAGAVPGGTLTAWADYARRFDEGAAGATEVDHDFMYVWLNYRYTLHDGERGAFYIGPEWRIARSRREGDTQRMRHKIELNIDATFK